ncbi:exodeoxyribonuclease III [Virgibacillus pantothenticus]|uniref:Endonuclease n=1 Tax=Virgibacillus pantothenticus TaxID=1473 RepID=A0A0L0QUK2_VIRPA|nr:MULTISPECIES: endonuclease/exonuclease/phosphatase family protein [Virgibacillus]API91168.1 endonuclease [Virgibacillus sp. 6R]KNE21878.1 endonuclease [Virgibacillus pantothenticus]MBS7429160.1 endonuclease/exonuclease/phosphatase family protein [Virgibacillus sp. 19R1-5]MBU8566812.1 endonuclease/exonuclease/phosphatase family protein [Virgibacillus pantothenticus]MBU8600495.1 endonuclease/exonuclease/phosphatase family protein [Virgibacillus pantothenticus]
MKILTLNCHSWQEEAQLEKLAILAQTIHKQFYDVIALQEVSQSIAARRISGELKEDNFILLLQQELQALGSTYEFVWDYAHIAYDQYEEGIALLTKHKVISKQSFFVSESEDLSYWKTRKAVGMTIDIDGKVLDFYSCHMGWWNDESEPFRRQMDQLVHCVSNGRPHFLAGDFNNEAAAENEGYDYIQQLGYYDTYQLAKEKDAGITVQGDIAGWTNSNPEKRIDYIFSSEKVNVIRSQVVFNGSNLPIISDHFGIEATIVL